jgi:MoxR-like ATPase
MTALVIRPGHITELPSREGLPERFHEFDERSIGAVKAALAAKRPLLVRGEPGVGKTQLAEAVAIELKRAFYSFTVDSRTESRDLLWHFDAVMRLAQAQLLAAVTRDEARIERELSVRNFVYPGPLWWAFDSNSALAACRRGGATPLDQERNRLYQGNGWVVLIDEIDKAESDVPNGLLEALGSGQFTPFGYEEPVTIGAVAPLIILTTNRERSLPDAFVRRCLVLQLDLPSEAAALIAYLQRRGQAHFGRATTRDVLRQAAEQLVADRQFAERAQLSPLPGQAEYLDLVRAVIGMAAGNKRKQRQLIDAATRFTLKKHEEMWERPSGEAS